MFAIFIVLFLSASAIETMDKGAAPKWVSPSLEAPAYRPGMGNPVADIRYGLE